MARNGEKLSVVRLKTKHLPTYLQLVILQLPKLDYDALSQKLDEGLQILEEPTSVDEAMEVLKDYLVRLMRCLHSEKTPLSQQTKTISEIGRLPILELYASGIVS